jgi:hypothetical protein
MAGMYPSSDRARYSAVPLAEAFVKTSLVVVACLAAAAVSIDCSSPARAQISVTTYHYDNYRSGWNPNETTLTPTTMKSGNFGLLQTVPLDDQVDAQPLVLSNYYADNSGTLHDVVYVVTESNSVYAVQADSGVILARQNLGKSVPNPLGCHNTQNVGINGTPVIDLGSGTLYVIAYTMDPPNTPDNPNPSGGPAYRIHALDLATLADQMPPVFIAASNVLTNGNSYNFNPRYEHQRPGLVEANGNIYAAFGSFCENPNSRGWLLGWQAGSLTPLPTALLTDSQATSPKKSFLTSIWMSGYAPSVDDSGNIYFVTGNSDPTGTTYDDVDYTDIQESVVKVTPALDQVLDLFTPHDYSRLDKNDLDFGSGGVMLVPSQAPSAPALAVAAGKTGIMYIMDQNHLGGYQQGPAGTDDVLFQTDIGGCHCGPSFFNDGQPKIISSGGRVLRVWNVESMATGTSVTLAGLSPPLPTGQDPGFFTSVSSNGADSAIIWLVTHPYTTSMTPNVSLYAFAAEAPAHTKSLPLLFNAVAGPWNQVSRDANIVPVVANGKVYVASDQQLSIFGLGAAAAVTAQASPQTGN